MCALGKGTACILHRNLRGMHREHVASQNNAARVSQRCKGVCGPSRSPQLLLGVFCQEMVLISQHLILLPMEEDMVCRGQIGSHERPLKITTLHSRELNTREVHFILKLSGCIVGCFAFSCQC